MSNISNKFVPIVIGMVVLLGGIDKWVYKGSIAPRELITPSKSEISIEKRLDIVGGEDLEIVQMLNSPSNDKQFMLHKIIVQNGKNRLESDQFSDSDLQNFEEVEVKQFGGRRILVVKGLDVGAHSSSMQFFMVNEDITKLQSVCSYVERKSKCIFTSDRMTEPLIEDLNGDNVPEVIELNVGLGNKVNVQIYQFISKESVDIVVDDPKFLLSRITPPNKEYSEIMVKYPHLN
jgi:hypothetical protein